MYNNVWYGNKGSTQTLQITMYGMEIKIKHKNEKQNTQTILCMVI